MDPAILLDNFSPVDMDMWPTYNSFLGDENLSNAGLASAKMDPNAVINSSHVVNHVGCHHNHHSSSTAATPSSSSTTTTAITTPSTGHVAGTTTSVVAAPTSTVVVVADASDGVVASGDGLDASSSSCVDSSASSSPNDIKEENIGNFCEFIVLARNI